jgi:DNA invertase Pin-like site-specific DNA recombinase
VQKAIGYIRVSTQGQADEGVSLEAQRAKIRAWCELNDAELVAVFEDAGLSGASMKGREGLAGLLLHQSPGTKHTRHAAHQRATGQEGR